MYFFDTYAIIESYIGNPRFSRFEPYPFVVSALNIGEFYEYLYKRLGKAKADYFLKENSFERLDLSNEEVIEAVIFRMRFKERKFSWADALGYALAKKNHLRFLTGDSQFKDLPNVEFVQ